MTDTSKSKAFVSKSDEKLDENKRKEIIEKFPLILQIDSICFPDGGDRPAKPLVRCLPKIEIKDLVREVIYKQWNLSNPRIVVIVMSNLGSVHTWTNTKQIKSFQKGLMKAAENTNMWLIANGIDIGATSIIGEAVANYETESIFEDKRPSKTKFNFIGIAEEGRLKNLKAITKSDKVIEGTASGQNSYTLNQNLTHYLLISDKTEDKNGVNEFLLRLIKFLSDSQKGMDGKGTESYEYLRSIEINQVPIVSMVIKGGYGCSRLVWQQIKDKIPVVVLRGSGGLADLLAYVDNEIRDRCLNVWDPEFVETFLKPELKIKIIELFPNMRNNSDLCHKFREIILESIQMSRKDGQNYLTVINMYDKYSCHLENLTEYLLLALFRSQRSERIDAVSSHIKSEVEPKPSTQMIRKDLNLCVDWNCPEMAKKEVLSIDPTFEVNKEKRIFESSLIRSNRWQFVDLFLSQKFKMRTFVSKKTFRRMFGRQLLSRQFFTKICWESVLSKTSDIFSSESIQKEINLLIEICTGIKEFVNEEELNLFVAAKYERTEKEAERKSLALIVFWALFDFRHHLVRILWRHSDQPIHLALVIAIAYERLSWYSTEESLRKRLKDESKLFISFASDLLDIIHKESALRAEQILNESTIDWNYYTAVDLASFGRFRTFFTHESVQRWLTNQTYGNIGVREVRLGLFRLPSMIKLLMSAYFLLPSYFWIKFPNYKRNDISVSKEVFESEEEDSEVDTNEFLNKKHLESDSDNPESDSEEPQKSKVTQQSEGLKQSHPRRPDQSTPTPPWHVIVYEVWTAPITKFWNFQFFYTFYLSIFSFAVLYPRCGNYYLDVVVIIWTTLIVIDAFRQNYLLYKRNTKFSISFRFVEISLQIVFIIFYTYIRIISGSPTRKEAYVGKVFMCLALLHAYYVLFTVFLPISATLGPLLYRLKIMILVDFLNFIRLSILVMISFGIVIQAVLYPDMSITSELLRSAFHRAFFSMFQSFSVDLLVDKECEEKYRRNYNSDSDECTASPYIEENCRVTGFWPYFLLVIYYILLKMIFMTLLYAIFSSSAVRLTADTDSIWKFQRYGLVMDFVTRAPIPPPLNVFYYIYWIIRHFLGKCCPNDNNKSFETLNRIRDWITPQPMPHKESKLLADDKYTYLRILASKVFEKFEESTNSGAMAAQHFERTKANSEELEYQRKAIRQMKGNLAEIKRSIRRTNTTLESIRKMITKKD